MRTENCEGFTPVTPAKPCPACGKPDWCSFTADGSAVICMRRESHRVTQNGGWLHRLAEDRPSPTATSKSKNKPSTSTVDWPKATVEYAVRLDNNPDLCRRLTQELSLPVEAFEGYHLGVSGIEPGWTQYTIPERDGFGSIIGISTRTHFQDGRGVEKKCLSSSRRGLVIRDGIDTVPGTLYLVEGMTDTVAMTMAGLACVGRPSNSGGGNHLEDLLKDTPPDRAIIVVGEHDRKEDGRWPGREGAEKLARELIKTLTRRIGVSFPPAGVKDVRAWLIDEVRKNQPWPQRGAELAKCLELAVEYAPATEAGTPATGKVRSSPTSGSQKSIPSGRLLMPKYRPFPLDALPEPIRAYVEGQAAAIGCDPAFAILPALALSGSAIGGALIVSPKRGWKQLPTVYVVVVADSGTGKSPSAEPVIVIAQGIEDELEAEFVHAVAIYAAELEAYQQDPEGKEKPKPPGHEYFLADDITIERLVENLRTSHRGLFVLQDELANWFLSFARYKGKSGGSDAPKWLSFFEGHPVNYQRRTATPGTPREVRIKRGIVSISGGIQPGILKELLSNPSFIASGLMARFLPAYPPKHCPRFTDAELDPEVEARFREVVLALRALPYDPEIGPATVRPDPAALQLWKDFHDRCAARADNLDGGPMSAALPKLARISLRLALIHHAVSCVAEGVDPSVASITEVSMRAAIAMTEWFGHEAERVYAMLAEQPEDRDTRHLVELIQRKGGRIKPRDLQRINDIKYPSAASAEAALESLISAGVGDWAPPVHNERGGRPSRVFVLEVKDGNANRQNPTEAEHQDGEEVIDLSDTVRHTDRIIAEKPGRTAVVSGSVSAPHTPNAIDTSGRAPDSERGSVEDLSGETTHQIRRKMRIKPNPNGGSEGTS